MTATITSHELKYEEAEDELAFLRSRVAKAAEVAPKVFTNIGSSFDRAMGVLGFTVALYRPPEDVVAALRDVVELGVALFERAMVHPSEIAELRIGGQVVRVSGGACQYNCGPRWKGAVGAAMSLRDHASLDRLLAFNPAKFEGVYDEYIATFARALVAIRRESDDVIPLLREARRLAETTSVIPELSRYAAPMLDTGIAIFEGNESAFNQHLVTALNAYKDIHSNDKRNEIAEAVVPLDIVGLCAYAHDRGIRCSVESGYIPRWLINGTFM